MRRLYLLALLGGLLHCAPYPPETPETPATQSIREADLLRHLQAITRVDTQGRATASEGYIRAADYVTQQFSDMGVRPGWSLESGEHDWKQPVALDHYDYAADTILRLQRGGDVAEFRHGDGMIILNPGVRESHVSGAPVFVGFGIEEPGIDWNDYSEVDLQGRPGIIMTESPEPGRSGRRLTSPERDQLEQFVDRLLRLSGKKVAAILAVPTQGDLRNWTAMVDRNLRMPLFPTQRYAPEQPPLLPVPLILLGERAVQSLFAESETNPLDPGSPVHPEVLNGVEATVVVNAQRKRTGCFNLIGVVPGSDPSLAREVVVISAHLDHLGADSQGVFPGANDDASGCSAVIEVMEAVALQPFRRTVMAVLTTGEEIGHFGSLHFVRNLPPGWRSVVAAVTLEHLGRIDDPEDGLEILADPDFLSRLKAREPWMRNLPVMWSDIREDRSGKVRGSDTQSFRTAGIPVALLGGGGFPEYHTMDDTAERIDLPHLRFASRVAYAMVEELANSDTH